MLGVIILKEIRDIVGSTKFAVTFAVTAALIIMAFYAGIKRYKVNQSYFEASKVENISRMEGLTDWLRLRGTRVFLPPDPIATLVSGVSNDIGRTINVTGRGELTATDSRYNEDPLFAIFRFLDLEFMFKIVLSLFAILLGFDAISGERERGTLKLSFSNAVPRHTYLLGKLLGSFIVLGGSLLLASAVGSLLLPVMGAPANSGDWIRLGLIVLTGLLYFGAFLTMSVFVSASTRRSSSSFLAMLVIWIMSVLVIPRASALIAGQAIEAPSLDEIAAKKSRFARQLWEENRAKMASFKPSISGNAELMMQEFNRFMEELGDERDSKMAEYAGRLNEDRDNYVRRQEKLAFNLARVSPSASLTLAAAALAGTSLPLQNRFNDEANAYQETYGQFIKDKTGMNPGGAMIVLKMSDEEPEPIDPHELPDFQYAGFRLSESLDSAVVDMGILLFFNLIFFFGSFAAFVRYDVR